MTVAEIYKKAEEARARAAKAEKPTLEVRYGTTPDGRSFSITVG